MQEQLALADRLFPVGCRITASGLLLSFNPALSPAQRPHPVLHIVPPVPASQRCRTLAGAMALRHAPGPTPPLTPRQYYNAAHTDNTCAPCTVVPGMFGKPLLNNVLAYVQYTIRRRPVSYTHLTLPTTPYV